MLSLNSITARNKLIYFIPPIAMFIDIMVGTATLKSMLEQIEGAIPNKIAIPLLALMIVGIDLTIGTYKRTTQNNLLGICAVSIVPLFTMIECSNEVQNNFLLAEALEINLFVANVTTSLKYLALAFLSFLTHYLIIKQAKIIVAGYRFFGYRLYDFNGVTNDQLEDLERRKDEENDINKNG